MRATAPLVMAIAAPVAGTVSLPEASAAQATRPGVDLARGIRPIQDHTYKGSALFCGDKRPLEWAPGKELAPPPLATVHPALGDNPHSIAPRQRVAQRVDLVAEPRTEPNDRRLFGRVPQRRIRGTVTTSTITGR